MTRANKGGGGEGGGGGGWGGLIYNDMLCDSCEGWDILREVSGVSICTGAISRWSAKLSSASFLILNYVTEWFDFKKKHKKHPHTHQWGGDWLLESVETGIMGKSDSRWPFFDDGVIISWMLHSAKCDASLGQAWWFLRASMHVEI